MKFRNQLLEAIVANMKDEMEIGRAVGPFAREKEHAAEVFSTVTILGVDEPTGLIVEDVLKTPEFKQDLANALNEDLKQVAFNTYDVSDVGLLIVNTLFVVQHKTPLILEVAE